MFFSIIIPLYNRPDEINELLKSLTCQTYRSFEVIIIEDGSSIKSDKIVDNYKNTLDVHYHYKENSGQGFSRNAGFNLSKGDFFIILDSDCILPEHYLEKVKLGVETNNLDAFGGPDKAHPEFTPIQKAISYSMTSSLTTGGIRGGKKHLSTFHPRSFNMGFSRKVFEKTNGFVWTRLGEDLELSIRILKAGFKTGLIEDAFVYHKRRTDFLQFFKQLHFFGKARINVFTKHPESIKFVHILPPMFVLYIDFCLLVLIISFQTFLLFFLPILFFGVIIFSDAVIKLHSFSIGILSVLAAYIQLIAYGMGFISAFVNRIILRKKEIIKFCVY